MNDFRPAGLLILAIGCGACSSTGPDQSAWGSDQASLAMTAAGATLKINAGTCYGSYGDISEAIPAGTFNLTGTYTQLTGVFPGKTVSAATFSGAVTDQQMSISVAVPSLQHTFGPFVLTRGVEKTLGACLYP